MQAPALVLEDAFAVQAPRLEEAPLEEASPAANPVPLPASWSARLVGPRAEFSLRGELSRAGAGLGLATIYGLGLGARAGGSAFLVHALGVPAALVGVIGVGLPALYITLALFDAPVEPSRAASAAARAVASTGLTLAGLAPAAALFVVSSDEPRAAAMAGACGLAIAGVIGLRLLLVDLGAVMARAETRTRTAAALAFGGFGVFAVALAIRVWWALLPVLGGGR